jgi:hypothetical protein
VETNVTITDIDAIAAKLAGVAGALVSIRMAMSSRRARLGSYTRTVTWLPSAWYPNART